MASVDSIEDNTLFAKKNDAEFPILSDADKSVAEAYGVLSPKGYARRWTFYIDANAVIVKIDKEVNPITAGQDIVDNLKSARRQRTRGQLTPVEYQCNYHPPHKNFMVAVRRPAGSHADAACGLKTFVAT